MAPGTKFIEEMSEGFIRVCVLGQADMCIYFHVVCNISLLEIYMNARQIKSFTEYVVPNSIFILKRK